MAYRARRSYAPQVDSTRREICGSVTSGTHPTFTDEVVTLPNVPDQSMGLRIHEFSVEWVGDQDDWDTDLDQRTAILSTRSGTTEEFISDPEVIAKIKTQAHVVTAVGVVMQQMPLQDKLYPPRIVMGTQFHIKTARLHGAATCHYRIVYSLIKLSMAEALAALTTMQF